MKVSVIITLKKDVLDPQGKVITDEFIIYYCVSIIL